MSEASSLASPAGGSAVARILIGEDDEMLAQFLEQLLRNEGYGVECVAHGPAVLSRVDATVDLVLLDLNLPEVNGLDVLRQLRERVHAVPVLVITGRTRMDGLLPALDGGADDCLLKPFSYLELLARVRVLLRRRLPAVAPTTSCADLTLHRDHPSAKRGDRRIELTQREYALLEFLMRTPGIPVARATLLREIWGGSCEPSTNVVDVYMKYVRDKVDLPGLPKLVRTVRGTGYMVSAA